MVRFTIIFVILCLYHCFPTNTGSELKSEKGKESLEAILVFQSYQTQGNCLVTNTQTNPATRTCNRRIRALCNEKSTILTSAEINLLLLDLNSLRRRFPTCEESFVFSGILSLKETSVTEIENIRKNQTFLTVATCEGEGFSSSKRIATNEEIQFLSTAKGRMGQGANRILNNRFSTTVSRDNARACLDSVFSEAERELLSALGKGDVLLEFP